MTGTWVNLLAIVVGSMAGLLLKRGIPERVSSAVLRAQGVAICVIGVSGMLSNMLAYNPATGGMDSSGGLLLLISMVLGCVAGELLRLDDTLNRFGMWVERRIGDKGKGFSQGFVSASLIFCVGVMSIIGPLNGGLTGDGGVLYIKSMLDGTTAIILASTLGFGVLFAAVPVLVIQGAVTLLAQQLQPFVNDELLGMFSMVGYAIVFCVGVNFLLDAKIKTANLLPSMLVPIVYYFVSNALV